LVGGILAVAGLILAVTTENPSKVVPGMLVILGLLAGLTAFVSPRWRFWLGGGVAAALAASGILAWTQPDVFDGEIRVQMSPSPTPISAPSASPSPIAHNIVVTEPGPSQSVPECVRVKGTGDIPAGTGLWVFVGFHIGEPDVQYWVVQRAKRTERNKWAAYPVSIGGPTDSGPGATIHVVLVDRITDNYLANSNGYGVFWSRELPPSAQPAADPIPVVRVLEPGGKSCQQPA
jgi:hypothetical protein